LEYLKEKTGRYPIIYSRAQWLNTYVDMARLPKNLDYWLAHYLLPLPGQYAKEKTPPPALPNGVSTWRVHQTGDQMPPLFNCASKVLDYDRWNGSDADVREWFGYGEVEPEPEPEPPEPEPAYLARVTATAGLNVRSGAGYSYPISAPAMVFGTIVEVYENALGWSRHNKGGWSNSAWLEKLDDNTPPQPPPVITEPYYGALYWQKDPRWVNERLGTGTSTIGGYGCVITSEANVLNQLGVVTNPFVDNKWRTENNGYFESNKIIWERVQEQHPEIVWDGRMYNPTDAQMIAKVQAGCGLVILVDHIEASAPLNEHWVCSVNRGNDVLWIYDPWDGVLIRYRDRYKKATLQCTSYRRKQ
jgi:Glycosyl hydrolases family 25.